MNGMHLVFVPVLKQTCEVLCVGSGLALDTNVRHALKMDAQQALRKHLVQGQSVFNRVELVLNVGKFHCFLKISQNGFTNIGSSEMQHAFFAYCSCRK